MSRARSDDAEPFVATLNGVAVARLAWSGWTPVGLAVGLAVYAFGRRRAFGRVGFSWQGGEASAATQAVYGARESAMQRLYGDAARLGAAGVLGIEVTQDSHVWGRRAVEFAAIGTAVARTSDEEEVHPPQFAISVAEPAEQLRTDLRPKAASAKRALRDNRGVRHGS